MYKIAPISKTELQNFVAGVSSGARRAPQNRYDEFPSKKLANQLLSGNNLELESKDLAKYQPDQDSNSLNRILPPEKISDVVLEEN